MITVLCLTLAINFAVRLIVIPQVENPVLRYSTVDIPTVKTNFIYSDILKLRHNFYVDENKELESIKPTRVKPNTELKFIFNHEPSSYALFRRLDNGNYEKVFDSVENSSGVFTAPEKSGRYVFSISANYKEGLGIYYFLIVVSDK